MSRKFLFAGIILLFGAGNILAQKADQQAEVKYISADHVYVNAGKKQGIAVGDTLKIFENGRVKTYLKVSSVAQHSSSCEIITSQKEIKIGDQVRFWPDKTVLAPKTKPERRIRQVEKMNDKRESNLTRISGYISLQWYQYVADQKSRFNFRQPSASLKIKARNLWNDAYHLRIKMRSRYNERSRRFNENVPETEWRNRIYELSFSYDNPAAAVSYKIGRIISNAFSGIGYIDGVLLQHNTAQRFSWGVFAGAQPEWQYSELQTSLQKYGLFLNYNNEDNGQAKFESTLSAAGIYHGSTISREFLFLQNSYSYGKRWSLHNSLELDVNRQWRKNKTGKSFCLSGLYLHGRYNFSDKISIGLNYDNRQNYFTYNTRSVADSLFDNAFRQGVRGSLHMRISKSTRVSVNAGIRKRDTGDITYSFSGGFSATNLFSQKISISARISGFSNLYTEGFSPSLGLNKYFNGGHSVGFNYGSYVYKLKRNVENRLTHWAKIHSNISLPYRMYLSANFEYDWGDDRQGKHIFAEMGYRF